MRRIKTEKLKTKILLVDDMPSMRMIVKSILKQIGYNMDSVVESSDGLEASKRLKTMNVDLIICDWDMPNMCGIDLLKFVRKNNRLEGIPFIMLTANSDAEKIHLCISEGVDNYVFKPFQPNILNDKLIKMHG